MTAPTADNVNESELFDRPLLRRLVGADRFVERAWLRERIEAAWAALHIAAG